MNPSINSFPLTSVKVDEIRKNRKAGKLSYIGLYMLIHMYYFIRFRDVPCTHTASTW